MQDKTEGYRLSPQQRWLWWMRERDGVKDAGRASVVLKLSGPLDLGALRRAIELVCERHEALRTSFFEAPSIRLPLQVVGSRASVCWIENGHDGVDHRDASAAGLIVNVSRLAEQEHDVELTASPLCVDSASLQMIAQEVTQCYRAVTAGVTLVDELMQYPDYADWQNELLAADDDEARTGKAYWQRAHSVALKLPCEPVGDSRSGPVHETVVRKIDGDPVAAAGKLSASAEGYLLTCWIALLSRLSGNTKVVVAERVSGRKYDELEKSIGLFEKWLPVHAVVDHQIYFRELVTQVEALRSEGREWQDYYPFGQRDGELKSFPAIGFAFSVFASPLPPVSANAGPLTFTVLRTERPLSGFKLLLSCLRKNDSLEIELQYNATAISRLDAERIVTQFTSILKEAANDPALRVGNVSLLSQDERETLVHQFNRTAAPAPLDQPAHRLFEAQVARTPDRLAVISGEIGLTFAGLNREANKLARFLRRRGVLDGAGVGLFLERSAHAVLGMLGIMKAGAAYVPLDINAPLERLQAQIKEIGSPVIVTSRDLFGRLTQLDIEAIFLDDDQSLFQSEADGVLPLCVDPESLAYIIYTSGSTGVPKGVAVTHRNLVNYAHFICREFQFYKTASQLNFAMVSAINADLGNTVIFPSLISGGCLHLLADEETTDAARLADRVARDRIDVLKIVPSHMNALTASSDGACVLPRRQLFLGGEQLTGDLLVRLKRMAPACELLNHYGPTEATVGALINHTENGGPQIVAEHAPVPIGSPIANLEAYVLDGMMQPVTPGVAGELYLGGEGVARGYQQQPAQTAEKFVPHPFATSTGARLYRTGDLARHLSNGKIEFIGRADDQVKIRGHRVELGEIKSALLDHPAVRDAVVVLRDERAGAKQLIAYVVGKLEANDLRAHLTARLPSYMLPAACVFIDRLPLTRNGKVDRSALPPPAKAASATRKLAPPRTPVEQTLAAIWKDLLGVDQISVDDNFFELGGDSIVSIQVVARARRAGLRLLPKQIFSAQTIAELASVAVPEVAQTAEPAQETVKGAAPLTPIQHWFFSLRLKSPNHFNLALLLSVPSEIEGSHLRAALVQVLDHHDALRLRFTRSEQRWIQYHAKPSEAVPFAEVDLSEVERHELSAAIEAECERWQRTLDITEGPLLRMILMRLGESGDNRLLIVAHHLVMDVVSWHILLDDLLLAYEQTRAGKAIELPAKTVSFRQWSEQLSEFARSEEAAEEIPYWRATIRGAAGRTPPVTKSHDKHVLETLNASLSSEATTTLLREALRAYRTEITDLLLTALARAVSGWNGQSKLLVEMEGHGREEFRPGLDVSRTVGWFTTHYPVLLDVEEEDEPVVTLKRVKDLLRAVPRRGLGFELLRWLRGDHQLAEELKAASRADIKFNYLGQLDGAISPASMFRVAPESSGTTREAAVAGSLFDTSAAILDGRLHLRLMFDSATCTSARMQALLDRYTNELLGLIRRCATATRSFTSSDLPAAKLNQSELDTFLAALATEGIPVENIEDIYRLSPMQEGLLFYSRSTPESDIYFRQLSCALRGELNVEALSLAWQTVLGRHPALRTSFHWTGLTSPQQVVNRRVELPVTQIDWRGLSAEEQSRRLEELVRDERSRGFNVSQAPLMRFVLLRLQDAEHHIVWSYHHLLMDGWAKHSVFNQLLECYRAFSSGEELNVRSSRPYVDYIKWLQSQDLKKAEAYWRRRLEGVYRPTPIGGRAASGGVIDQAFYHRRQTLLSQEATAAVQQFARSNQLTLNTVVQAAWAILLSRVSRQADVVFGAVVSGRPSDLEGSETMIGLFVNTLPVRIQVSPESEVLAWCRQIQEQRVETQQYEYSPLVMVQNWSSVSRGEKLFESLLVFVNYPIDAATSSEKHSLLMSNFNIVEYSSFPLALTIGPAAELSLLFLYDCRRFDDSRIAQMAATLSAILNLLAAARPETKLCEIDVALYEIESRELKGRQEELNELKLQKLKTIRRKMVQDDSSSKASV